MITFICFILFCVFTLILAILIVNYLRKFFWLLNRKVKVDLSTDFRKDSNTESNKYAIYYRDHFWNDWVEDQTFSNLDSGIKAAQKLSKYLKNHNLPNYY